jgi:putative ABC transport system substrate-binding protein
VRVIVTLGSPLAARAAKTATDTIPIVFGFGTDPVQQGLVASLNRPGGNVTGMTSLASDPVGKQLGMLHELLPQTSHFGFLSDPKATSVHELLVSGQIAAA